MSKDCFCGADIPDFMKNSIRFYVCKKLPVEFEVNGENYCLLHFPSKTKNLEFENEFQRRLHSKDYNFKGVYFPNEFNLTAHEFKGNVDFSHAIFSELTKFDYVVFSDKASFNSSTFYGNTSFDRSIFIEDATFWLAHFQQNALFRGTTFMSEIDFNEVSFELGAEFNNSNFGDKSYALFKQAIFYNFLSFYESKINGNMYFHGGKTSQFKNNEIIDVFTNCFEGEDFNLSFEHAIIQKPENVNFHTVRLRPSWFVNVDSRRFNFVDVKWDTSNTIKFNVRKELKHLEKNVDDYTKLLFKITCRQLAENAENNTRFEEASNFRRMAMETEWHEKKEKISNWIKNLVPESEKLKRRLGGSISKEDEAIPPINSFGILRRSGDFIIHALYRITSFYGESWSWAAFVLLFLILAAFPFFYTQTFFYICPNEKTNIQNTPVCENRALYFGEAVRQSLATATLQNVETRKPNSPASETFTLLEKILAPLQAALLALAIRRKFMR